MCVGRKFGGTANSAWQVWRKWGSVWAGDFSLSLSLVARTFWHAFGLNLKGFFTHFVVVFSHLIVNFSYFIVVFSRLFAYKRHFLGHCAFLKFLNSLFLGFCALFVSLSLCKKATPRVARRKPQQKNPKNLRYALFMDTSLTLSMTAGASLRAVCLKTADFVILSVAKNPKNLRYALFMDTSLTLSMTKRVFGMTNSGFCLKMTDIFTQILGTKFTNFTRFFGLPRSLCSLAMTAKQKFKFFIQNSTHFINLTQILSPTQGFFIFLPQVFAQCKLIKNFLQGGHCV